MNTYLNSKNAIHLHEIIITLKKEKSKNVISKTKPKKKEKMRGRKSANLEFFRETVIDPCNSIIVINSSSSFSFNFIYKVSHKFPKIPRRIKFRKNVSNGTFVPKRD